MATIQAAANNLLFIRQRVQTNIKGIRVGHRITFAQAAVSKIASQQLGSFLRFQQVAKVGKDLNISVVQSLNLTQETHPRVHNEAVVTWFYPYHDILLQDQWPGVRATLGLTQTVSVSKAKGCRSSLALAQTVALKVTRNLSAETEFTILQGTAVYKPTPYFILGLEEL